MARNPSYAVNFNGKDKSAEPYRFTLNQFGFYAADSYIVTDPVYDFINTNVAAVCDELLNGFNSVMSNKLNNSLYAPAGQREMKWLCSYFDNLTLALYQTELPCAKESIVTALPPGVGGDYAILTAPPWNAF